MSIAVIIGGANSGKTGALYAPLVDAAQRGEDCVLLLPSQAEVLRAQEEFSQRVPVGIRIETLDSWAAQLWGLWGDGRRLVDPVVRHLAVADAIKSVPTELTESSKFAGYGRLVSDICSRSGGLGVGQGTSLTDHGLVAVLERYRAILLDWGLVEPGEAMVRLADQSDPVPGVISLNRFSDLSAQQQQFIVGLSRRSRVLIGLTYDDGAPATEALQGLVERLRAVDGSHCIPVAAPPPTTELEAVAVNLFTGGRVEPQGSVEFAEAAGPEAEMALIAESVSRLVSQGTAPERIAVVFRDMTEKWRSLESALHARGLEVETDVSMPFSATPLGAALLKLVDVAQRTAGGREELISLFSGPYFAASTEDLHDLDRLWRRRRLDDPRQMLHDCTSLGPEAKSAINAAIVLVEGSGDGSELGDLADVLMSAALKRPRCDSEVRLDAMAHRRALETAVLIGSLPCRPSAGVVGSALGEVRVATGSTGRHGAVAITETHRIRGRRFDVVVLGGLTASEFSSERREPLSAHVLGRLGVPTGTETRLVERLLFHSIATRAREKLILVRQRSDARGEPVRASLFWDEMLDLYRTEEGSSVRTATLGLTEPHRAAPVFRGSRLSLRERVFDGKVEVPHSQRGTLRGSIGIGSAEELSVTELETYLSCPYKWFYERVLRPRSLDRAFDAREKGSLAHALLAHTYRAMRADGIDRVTPESVGEARRHLDVTVRRLSEEHRLQRVGVAEELAWNQAVRWAGSTLEQDSDFLLGFIPVEEEWGFGGETGRVFTLEGVPLRGFVDRIDRGPDGVIVTDYKSSSAVAGHAAFQASGLLQPVVYSMVAQEVFDTPAAAGLYRSLSTGAVAGFWNEDRAPADEAVKKRDVVDEEGYRAIVERTRTAVVAAAEGILSGIITPRPTDEACKYCGARDVCEARS